MKGIFSRLIFVLTWDLYQSLKEKSVKTILIKLVVVLALGGGFYYMSKTRSDKPKDYTFYDLGYSACIGGSIGYLGGVFQKRKSKEGK
jgi:hypothetical protein